MKITKILIFLLLIQIISSCRDSDEEPALPAPVPISDSEEGAVINPEESTFIVDKKSFLKKFKVKDPIYLEDLDKRYDSLSNGREYFFDIISGKCFDRDGNIARGVSSSLECNVPEVVGAENSDFIYYDFFGADARNSNLEFVDVSLYELLFAEVKINKETLLKEMKFPYYKMFNNHKKIFFQQKNTGNSFSKKLSRVVAKKKKMKKLFKKAKNDTQRLRIKEKINKINEQIRILKLNYKIAKNKSKRHLKELKWVSKVSELDLRKEKFSSKNKKFYSYDGRTSHKLKASNELITSKNFSISVWFRTDVDQSDKRLVNLHRGVNPGSALNLSLKSDRIVMGLHDGNRYISNEVNFEYDDNLWHNFVVVKSKKKVFLYINGQKRLEYRGEFSGFGTYPAIFGSFNGSGYNYSGELDEVSIWSKSLSRGDVKKIFNNGFATDLRIHLASPFLKNWWRMGDHKLDTDDSLYDVISKEFAEVSN